MKVSLSPALTRSCPVGLIDPPGPADAVIVNVDGGFCWKAAEIVWLVSIEVKV